MQQLTWNWFCKTGDIDAYMLGREVTALGASGANGVENDEEAVLSIEGDNGYRTEE